MLQTLHALHTLQTAHARHAAHTAHAEHTNPQTAGDGTPAAFVGGGEAGVGKSRLVGELASLAIDAEVRTLTGACVSLIDCSAPLLPIVGALRAAGEDAAHLGDDALSPDELLGSAWSGTLRRYEVIDGALMRLAAAQPVLLVLEDIHWADRSTLEFLMFLLRGLQAHERRFM